MSTKVMIIGLDGAGFNLLHALNLPNIEVLKKRGSWGVLQSVIPPVTAPAWATFLTGRNPGKHGVFEFMQREEGNYRLRPVNSTSIKTHTFVDVLSSEGKQSVLINVPVTYPPQPLNGLCITGLLTPGTDSRYTYPDQLKQEIEKNIKGYIISTDEIFSPGHEERFLCALERQIEKRTELAVYLMNNYKWDFFMVLYSATDTVQHGLWGYGDPQSHIYDCPNRKNYSGGIERIYRNIDNQVGKLYRQVGGDTNFIMMSDHGAGSLYWFFHVNVFLMNKGFLKIKKNLRSQFKLMLFKLGFTLKNTYHIANRLGLGRSRAALDSKRTRRNLLTRLFLSFKNVDWENTVAYSRGYIGQIFINLKGREPKGIVTPGDESESLQEEIISELKKIKIPGQSKKLISSVFKSEELYHGKYAEFAPDITFLTKNLEAVAFGNFEFTSNREIEKAYTGISGHHQMEGIYIFSGPAFRKKGRARQLNIPDLAPLILKLFDCPLENDMDGKVPLELLNEKFRGKSGAGAKSYKHQPKQRHNYRVEDIKRITEKLRSLGYLG